MFELIGKIIFNSESKNKEIMYSEEIKNGKKKEWKTEPQKCGISLASLTKYNWKYQKERKVGEGRRPKEFKYKMAIPTVKEKCYPTYPRGATSSM